MKSYLQGMITGGVMVFATIVLTSGKEVKIDTNKLLTEKIKFQHEEINESLTFMYKSLKGHIDANYLMSEENNALIRDLHNNGIKCIR